MQHIWDRKLVLVTGKGGVGKSVITAALARAAHAAGRRVLVSEVTPDVSTHSRLLAHFGRAMDKAEEPIELEPRLHGVRITPSTGHKLFLRAALRVRLVVDAAMKSAALTRFLMAAPTFPEIGALYQLVTLLRDPSFDHVFVDLPATGHALALAALPKTVLKIVPSGLIGDAIREGLETMTDPKRGCALVVTLPESMPITESLELAESLDKLKIPVRAMVLNKMPPDPFSADEKQALAEHLASRTTSHLLGAREYKKLLRALDAREGFRRSVPSRIPRAEVPLFDSTDDRVLLGELAKTLSAALEERS
ncbi:arsenic transporter [Myxococcota bacterium]|nr:arsenic transporter [Myxococcota bacterium]